MKSTKQASKTAKFVYSVMQKILAKFSYALFLANQRKLWISTIKGNLL